MENLYIITVLVVVGYVALYFSGRKYLEGFENRFNRDGSPVTDASTIMNKNTIKEKEYPMQPKMDMYDVSAVYNNQGSKPASKKQSKCHITIHLNKQWLIGGGHGPTVNLPAHIQLNFQRTSMPQDGSCLFHAIAHATHLNAAQLREQAANQIHSYAHHYQQN